MTGRAREAVNLSSSIHQIVTKGSLGRHGAVIRAANNAWHRIFSSALLLKGRRDRPMLKLENLSKSYGKKRILEDIKSGATGGRIRT